MLALVIIIALFYLALHTHTVAHPDSSRRKHSSTASYKDHERQIDNRLDCLV